jgi:hypothetical protein
MPFGDTAVDQHSIGALCEDFNRFTLIAARRVDCCITQDVPEPMSLVAGYAKISMLK